MFKTNWENLQRGGRGGEDLRGERVEKILTRNNLTKR